MGDPIATFVREDGTETHAVLDESSGDVIVPFEPVISDPESIALEWVHPADVELRPLHPGFAAAWPALRLRLPRAAAG